MENTLLKDFVAPGIALLVTVAFGIWLALTGRPYNGALFNVHKLVALGLVILAFFRIRAVLGAIDSPALSIVSIVVAALSAVALFATGAMMSIGKPDWAGLRVVHAGAFVLGAAALVMMVYSLGGGKL